MDRQKLIRDSLKYARAAASRYTLQAPRQSAEWQDAFSCACVALVEAAKLYDPSFGTLLGTFAWPRMRRAILRMRESQKARWGNEDQAARAEEGAAAPSPEDLLERAEREVEVSSRLGALSPEGRSYVLDVLDNRPRLGKRSAKALCLEAGVRPSASDLPKAAEPLSQSARGARWFARLSPEKREARNALKRQRRAEAKRAA